MTMPVETGTSVHELTKTTGRARPQPQNFFLLGDFASLSLGAEVPTIGHCQWPLPGPAVYRQGPL